VAAAVFAELLAHTQGLLRGFVRGLLSSQEQAHDVV
jgi:hypothetical protein